MIYKNKVNYNLIFINKYLSRVVKEQSYCPNTSFFFLVYFTKKLYDICAINCISRNVENEKRENRIRV